jgi:hypothetical protein
LGIVTNRIELDTRFAKVIDMVLQLDQLRAAEGSPVRGTIEHNHRLASFAIGVEVMEDAVLIRELEIRNSIADRWAGRKIVRGGIPATGAARGLW